MERGRERERERREGMGRGWYGEEGDNENVGDGG